MTSKQRHALLVVSALAKMILAAAVIVCISGPNPLLGSAQAFLWPLFIVLTFDGVLNTMIAGRRTARERATPWFELRRSSSLTREELDQIDKDTARTLMQIEFDEKNNPPPTAKEMQAWKRKP